MLPTTTQVLVIGGGHAAMCAAITALEAGCQVTVLESAPKAMRGGNSRHTRNLRARHDQPTDTLTGAYTADEYWADLLQVTGGRTNEKLARLMIANSESLLHWLAARGVHFQPALSGTLNLSSTNAFFLGGGKALLNSEYQYAAGLGAQVFYDAEVTAVDLRDGRCCGATVVYQGTTTQVQADAVIVASGGFQANAEWMREAWGPAADNFLIRGTPYNRGVVLRSLMAQGASTVGEPQQCHAVAIDARAPRYDGGIVSRLDCVCFSVVVNQQGQRFYDEGEDFWPRRYAIWGRLVAQQPGQIAYAIIDSKVSHQFMPSVYPPLQADSVAELADVLGIAPQMLSATLAEFNASVGQTAYDMRVLDGCATRGLTPPKSNWALAIDTPPFFAYPLRPGITFTYLGLQVDEHARVQIEQQPVDNLFAAGEVMAGNILGQGYCAGTGMTIGGVFGRIAGEQAAQQCRWI